MIVIIVGVVFYVVKTKRYSSSTNSVGKNYELPTLPKPSNRYEEIRNKIDNVSEHSEIGIFHANTSRSEYSNIALYRTELDIFSFFYFFKSLNCYAIKFA